MVNDKGLERLFGCEVSTPGKEFALDLVLQLLAAGEQSKPYHTDHQVWFKSRLLGKQ